MTYRRKVADDCIYIHVYAVQDKFIKVFIFWLIFSYKYCNTVKKKPQFIVTGPVEAVEDQNNEITSL